MRKPTNCFPTRSDTNWPAQSRSLKLCMKVEEKLYYPCSENKGSDNHEADLRLCFRICKLLVFSCGDLHILDCLVIAMSQKLYEEKNLNISLFDLILK